MARASSATKQSPQFARSLAPEVSTPLSLPSTGMEAGELVTATNVGSYPFTVEYASKKYVLAPNKSTRLPFEAACLWFGDPRSGPNVRAVRHESGMVEWIPDRSTEVRRLRLKYGNHFGDERGLDEAPSVDVETMDGDRIPTVIQYPDGIPTMEQPGMTDIEALRVQLIRQQNTINRLLAHSKAEGIDVLGEGEGDGEEREELVADADG